MNIKGLKWMTWFGVSDTQWLIASEFLTTYYKKVMPPIMVEMLKLHPPDWWLNKDNTWPVPEESFYQGLIVALDAICYDWPTEARAYFLRDVIGQYRTWMLVEFNAQNALTLNVTSTN